MPRPIDRARFKKEAQARVPYTADKARGFNRLPV